MKINKKIISILIILVIVLGIILRILYIEKTPFFERQHDLGGEYGGYNYILTIYTTGHLPDNNEYQNYHPPLHFLMCAGWLRVINCFHPTPLAFAESLQILTFIYSLVILSIAYLILKELKFNGKTKLLIMSIISFHPSLIILSGSINNDELCLMFILWAILRLIKWYQKSDIKNTLFLAIVTGLSVMTKTTGAIIAIPIIYVFLLKLYKKLKKSKNKINVLKEYLSLFVFFGSISLPIGLWYHIRNYILFNQPILYVLDPQVGFIYIGDKTLTERFISLVSFKRDINKMYCNLSSDCNIPAFVLKSSLFGEYSFGVNSIFKICYTMAIIANIVLVIYAIYSIIRSFTRRNKRNIVWRIALFLLEIFNFISFLIMNYQLPYRCSMDFRYLYSTLFIGAIFIGFELNNVYRKNKIRGNISYAIIFILAIILCSCANYIILK